MAHAETMILLPGNRSSIRLIKGRSKSISPADDPCNQTVLPTGSPMSASMNRWRRPARKAGFKTSKSSHNGDDRINTSK